jgi:hypothetical protein
MPRSPQNVRERAIGMLNAGMTTTAVAMNIGCSTRAIRYIRQRFQATERTIDRPRSGRPRVTTRAQAIFGTPTCTISSKLPQPLLPTPTTVYQSVRNHLLEGGLHGRQAYVGCV